MYMEEIKNTYKKILFAQQMMRKLQISHSINKSYKSSEFQRNTFFENHFIWTTSYFKQKLNFEIIFEIKFAVQMICLPW